MGPEENDLDPLWRKEFILFHRVSSAVNCCTCSWGQSPPGAECFDRVHTLLDGLWFPLGLWQACETESSGGFMWCGFITLHLKQPLELRYLLTVREHCFSSHTQAWLEQSVHQSLFTFCFYCLVSALSKEYECYYL